MGSLKKILALFLALEALAVGLSFMPEPYVRCVTLGKHIGWDLFERPAWALIASPNLMAAWRFEGNGYDSSGRGHTMEKFGDTTWNTAQKFGMGIVVDGNDDYTSCSDHADFTPSSGVTMSAWVKLSAITATAHIVGQWNASALSACRMYAASGYVGMGMYSGSDTQLVVDNTSVMVADQWHHCAVVYLGGTGASNVLIYKDGALVKSGTFSLVPNNGAISVTVGCSFALANDLSGNIDEVRIHNRPLNASEIKALVCGFEPGEIAY